MATSSLLWSSRTALLGVIGGLACAFLTAGCTAEVRTYRPVVYTEAETDVVYTESVPVSVETYPREYYGGVAVYLVDGRWYRRSGNRWQTYRSEPVELGRRRAVIERRSPPRALPREERRDGHGYHHGGQGR